MPSLRAMADTLSPCRFKSWIKTISPSVITCLPLPFRACRWGVSAAAVLRGACPPQNSAPALRLGTFQTALLGSLRSALTLGLSGRPDEGVVILRDLVRDPEATARVQANPALLYV
jgi:hypothetical protein